MSATRWSVEQAARWSAAQAWPAGCNFIPSTAINQLAMWQADTFDPRRIELELSWAARLGFNTMRVYLHDLLHTDDWPGFAARLDEYLAVADGRGLRTIFVFFDDCWNSTPRLGAQPAPEPHLHNSHWVESPGLAQVEAFAAGDRSLAARLERYVREVLARYGADRRILMWDLYNEPGGWMREPGRSELVGPRCLPLLRAVFQWAQAARPEQPLTSGVFTSEYRDGEPNEVSRVQLDGSDVVTFHNYLAPEKVERDIARLRELTGRPLICTEYMARASGSRFETVLPVLRREGVGAINWGLVAGRTQTIYPWQSWLKPMTAPPAEWFHDIFYADGRPYRDTEVAAIRAATGA